MLLITDCAQTACDTQDGNAGAYRGIQYSASVANVYSDVDQLPVNETWHPRLQNVVYNAVSYSSLLALRRGDWPLSIKLHL